ncbi:hypothetical protein D3C87_1052540 [compost metagenome]
MLLKIICSESKKRTDFKPKFVHQNTKFGFSLSANDTQNFNYRRRRKTKKSIGTNYKIGRV